VKPALSFPVARRERLRKSPIYKQSRFRLSILPVGITLTFALDGISEQQPFLIHLAIEILPNPVYPNNNTTTPKAEMSTRKSSRATKAVKYTSASEGSDFEDKKRKPRKTTTATPKGPTKRTKAAPNATTVSGKKAPMNAKRPAESDDNESSNEAAAILPPKPKRQKKDPETLAQEAQAKLAKADKALHKQAWQDWLAAHSAEGEMLEEEPDKEENITQTDALKKYGLKKEELTSLLRYEKKNPLYGGTMKLFLKDNVRELCFRKIGMLEGVEGGDDKILRRGEELWEAE